MHLKIISGFNNTESNFPDKITLQELFEEQVKKHNHEIAVICEHGKLFNGKTFLTYNELNQEANKLAGHLRDMGIGPDKIVGILVDRSFEMIIGIWGILKAGGAYLPIVPETPTERIQYILSNSGAEIVLVQSKYKDKISNSVATINLNDPSAYTGSAENLSIINTSKDLAYIIYTSGSTGKPKGVMIEHRSVVNRLNWMQKLYPLDSNDIILQKTPYSFDVSVWELFWWSLVGSKMCFLEPGGEKNAFVIAESIRKNKITVMHFVPSMMNLFLDYAESKSKKDIEQLNSLRYIFASGEALSPAHVKRFNTLLGNLNKTRLINLYGPTEATVDVSYFECPVQNDFDKIPIGKPIHNIQLYVVNNHKLADIGEEGELCIAGVGLARGYLNNPELTKEKFIPNIINSSEKMYKTGDLAKWLPDGNIEYLGRIDHQVKIRGFRIELGEIENTIRDYEGIKDCLVIVHKYSEDVISIIAYTVSDEEIDFEKLKSRLIKYLPEYMIPNHFVALDKIPLTSNGKADRKALPIPKQGEKHQVRITAKIEASSDDIENKLMNIWKELLGIESIGLNENFFDLGGNSILMARQQIKVNQVFNEEFSIVDFFQYPTISALAKFISKKKETSEKSSTYQVRDRNLSGSDIAIIGISCKYPGANTPDEFWQNIANGVESISFFTKEELEFLPKGALNPELKFVMARGVLKDADKFDAAFFGYTPREAEQTDPQHRVFLECAWEALEDAGYSSENFKGSIGVYAGSSLNAYLMFNVLQDRESQQELVSGYQLADYKTITGNDNGFLTTKIAYKLGLTGPAINVQTACSTSLVAIGQAYQSLISGQCDMALAGGVSITFPQKRGYFFIDGSIGSVDGHCKTFDADATGTVFSSGAGMIVMKRLEDAIKDNDSIYAVIKSVAINNDGASKAGYMTPSVDGQSEVIERAHKLAGINADTIKYVEAHGTGTPVGDPIEIAGLEKAFRLSTDAKQFCGIGSVKSNIGHTDAAAGVTGVIKTAMALKHKILPPSLHYKNPNPRIDFANSPFYVVDKPISLENEKGPIRAGVSAFGVGGTNAHAILEAFSDNSVKGEVNSEKQLLVVSAKTETALKNNMTALMNYLKNNLNESVGDVGYTLQQGRKQFEWRQFVAAENCKSAADEIENVIKSGTNKGKADEKNKPHLVFMFPGQGAQYVNMGKGLYQSDKVFKDTVDHCAEYLNPVLELDIRDLLYPETNNEESAKKLEQTVYTQPALFIVEYSLAQVLLNKGIHPASMIGHSIGDYVAACLAGVFNLEDTLYIIAMRARQMQKQEPGSMLSVRSNESEISKYLNDDVCLAAINSPNLLVLSGPTEKVKELSDKLTEVKIENRMLFTSHAYHSKMMEPAIPPFVAGFEKIKLNKPSAPFISSMTGNWITDEQATDPNFWAQQLRNTVRFSTGILELQKKDNLVMIEIGPGRALSTMASQHRKEKGNQTVITTLIQPNENNDDTTNVLNAIGKLWTSGLKIEWDNFHANKKRKRLHLPAYQFDHKSYWIEVQKNGQDSYSRDISKQIPRKAKKLVKKPGVKKVVQQNVMTRKEYITNIIKDVLEELSGIKKTDLDETKSFLELGFDSLFMTQISLAFQKKFEMKITLRQLLETTPTINSFSEFVESNLPEGKFEPPKQEVVIEEESEEIMEEYEEILSEESQQPEMQFNSVNGTVEKLVYEQLEIMKKQLEILGGKSSKSSPVIYQEKKEKKTETTAPTASAVVPSPKAPSSKPSKEEKEKKVFERFGPYKPIETKKGEGLTDQQQKYLDKLTIEYNKKTANSKKLTQKYRANYSDPRTVSGFLPIWKEMTYQVVTERSEGSKLWDIDGNEYVDVLMGFGQYLFGHNPKFVRDEIEKQLKLGFEIGPQSPIAGEVANMICEFTKLDRAAFCVTGSEAVLGAIRAARTVTGKDKVVFFAGDYHGIIDEVLIKTNINGDQIKTVPIAPGIPRENVQSTIALEYGTEESLKIIEKLLPEIAAVMVEPVQARRPDFQPKEFLQKLRKMTEGANVALIFDEVITGFRSTPGGAQEWFGVKADLATYGKVIGGGFPIGVIAGRKLYMDAFDGGIWQYGDDSIPEAGVTFFAGTFARHPLSLTGAYASLSYLKSKGRSLQENLNKKTSWLSQELNKFFLERNVPIKFMNFSSLMYYSYPKDLSYFSLLFYVLRHKGLHILEGFPIYLSTAHTDEDVQFVLNVFKESIIELQDNGFFPRPLNDKGSDYKIKDNKEVIETVAEKSNGANRFPLAGAQKEMWIGAQMRPEAAGPHHSCQAVYLDGSLNLSILKQSILEVIKRHEGLRCSISEDGSEAIVHDFNDWVIPFEDLSNLSEKQKDAKVNEILEHAGKRLFNLNSSPLVEFNILKLSDQRHLLIYSAQMIVCDGWGNYVIFEDLSNLYSSLVNNQTPSLDPPVPMHEYSAWQKKNEGSREQKECEAFWLSHFDTLPDPIDLPTSRPRPAARSFDGARVEMKLPVELYKSVKQLGREQKSSYFAVLLAAFNVWLNRLSGVKEPVVGVPFAAQSQLGMDRFVGQCANTLPLRTSIETNEPFSAVLKRTWNVILDAQDNWNFTYGELISKLNIPLDSSRIPLVSVLFNIDPPMDKVKFSGLKHKFITGPRFYYQYDLGFNLVEDESTITIECDYNPKLFDEDIMKNWVDGYISILESVVKKPDFPISRLPMVGKHDQKKILYWNTAIKENESEFIPFDELFKKAVGQSPDSIAVKSQGHSLTYKELEDQSNKLCSYFRTKAINPGTVVGICLNNAVELAISILGVIKSGCVYLLIEPDADPSSFKNFAEKNNVRIILSDDQTDSKISGKYDHSFRIRRILNEHVEELSQPAQEINPDGFVCLISKGSIQNNPAVVGITHRGLVNTILSLQKESGIDKNDVILHHNSLSSGYEIFTILLPLSVVAQCTISYKQIVSNPDGLRKLIEENKITMMLATPSQWESLVESGWQGNNALKVFSSGEFLSQNLVKKLSKISKEIWNLYGTAESAVFSMINLVNPEFSSDMGKPLNNTNVILVDENFETVPAGVPGEIAISGISVSNKHQKDQGFFRTGDYGRYSINGEIEFLYRADRRIKVRSFIFDPHYIESILQNDPSIQNAIVSLKTLTDGKARLVAYIIPGANVLEYSAKQTKEFFKKLRKSLRNQLPEYKVPESFVLVDEIPLNVKGKVDYSLLPVPDITENEFEDYIAPRNETEEKLAAIWKELLNVPKVSVKDSFFDLGGQSLMAVRLFNRIEQEFGQRFPLAMLYAAPTIEDLARKLTNEDSAITEWPSLIPIQPKGAKKPLFLVHGAGGNVLLYNALAKELEPDYPLYGLQSQGLDGTTKPLETVEEMAERYLKEIREVQPDGPYFLGGYCMGGTIAYEMAQRLLEKGEEIGIVAMLDTYNFIKAGKISFARFMLEKLKFHIKNFTQLKPSEMLDYFKEKKRLAGDGGWAHIRTEMPLTTLDDSFGRAESGIELSVQTVNDHAADTYIPKPYAGKLTLFKPQKNYSFYSDPKMGWGDLVKDLDIIEMPVNPHAMLVEPYVKTLAQELKDRLEGKVKTVKLVDGEKILNLETVEPHLHKV
jgi:amino acid adenylation domain-containing protein